MVEDTIDDSSDGAVYINSLVVPALNKLWYYPSEDLGGNFPGRFVENLSPLV